MIFAGNLSQANLASGDWVFVDIGFASAAKSCGFLVGSDQPEDITFSELKAKLLEIVRASKNPLNLLIEAPLSVSFNDSGNPTGRSVEKRGADTRYWYVSPGCSVLVAAIPNQNVTLGCLKALHLSNPRASKQRAARM